MCAHWQTPSHVHHPIWSTRYSACFSLQKPQFRGYKCVPVSSDLISPQIFEVRACLHILCILFFMKKIEKWYPSLILEEWLFIRNGVELEKWKEKRYSFFIWGYVCCKAYSFTSCFHLLQSDNNTTTGGQVLAATCSCIRGLCCSHTLDTFVV